jgi:hypothetical protein
MHLQSHNLTAKNVVLKLSLARLLVLDILKTEKSRVRDGFISYSKYSRRGTLFIQEKVGSALTETENWDLIVGKINLKAF